MKTTDYVKNLGIATNDNICSWWTLTITQSEFGGLRLSDAVIQNGFINSIVPINSASVGVCPALHIDLSSSLWSYAGKVSIENDNDLVGW